MSEVASLTECIEWTKARSPKGYGLRWYKGATRRAHRVAYCEAHGLSLEDIAGQSVLHSCDNPPCVNPEHLRLGDHTDNMRDRVERGTAKGPRAYRGEHHHEAKLTSAQVEEIRKRFVPYCKINGGTALAREFGVSQPTVSAIANEREWLDG